MNEKVAKVGLISLVASAFLGSAALLYNDYSMERQLDRADITKRISENTSWKDVAGFYDKDHNITKIVVRTSYAPLQMNSRVTSEVTSYKPQDKDFSKFAKVLTNSP